MGTTENGSAHAPKDLKQWRENMGYSVEEACAMLDVKPQTFRTWESYAIQTPRYIRLACAALALGIKV